MMEYSFGIYVPGSKFSKYIYRSINDLKNWLFLFDVIENRNNRIICRWARGSKNVFGLSALFVGKLEFRFGQYPICVNSVEKMDEFLNQLDQKTATIILIDATNPNKKTKKEIKKVMEKIIKEITLNFEQEEVKESQ